ncbi:MAG TPA: polysaccharide ABC transporter ATP-binding protein [Candidatus Acidoferrales bacterium]|nr:polysaccharide ABC transporter ATP-binding protein [Candidatus Acidoferrales bacterium]
MSEAVIHAEGLGKRYQIGERERYRALRDVLSRAFVAPFRRGGRAREESHLWALRDVSLEVRQGEVVGLIGRNGAGKTTLLKILSRITRPTTGCAEIRGRVGSLLEVGTGFHPELTGRENVFLSGAILGMKNSEISRKFDEIVSFAAVERFIDTPLKHFSTGMQMRLAFAVAAHLEPEILLVDEVLAVGDLEFQKKCLGKMQDVSRSGRTIIFVSHQMNQIRRLCERVAWIDAGRIALDGPSEAVIGAYEHAILSASHATDGSLSSREAVSYLGWEVAQRRGSETNIVEEGTGPISIGIRVRNRARIGHGHVAVVVYDSRGFLICGWSFDDLQLGLGEHDLHFSFPELPLRPGAYSLLVNIHDDHQSSYSWTLVPSLIIEGVPVTHHMDEWAGVLNIPCSMECKEIELSARTSG